MIAEIFLLSFLIFKNIYENSKYNKSFVKNQFREQNFETEGSTNDYISK